MSATPLGRSPSRKASRRNDEWPDYSGGALRGTAPFRVLGLEWVLVPGNLSQEDIDHIREGYRLFTEGDPAFLDRFTPDATHVFPETLPKGGTYGSPWDALEYYNTIGALFEDPRPEPEEYIRDGDRLVVLGYFHGRFQATDERVSVRFAHVFRLTAVEGPLSEQRYAAFELFIDTAAVLAAITGQGAG